MIYESKSPAAALELMKQFRKERKYDLFRGQNTNWEVASTFSRLDSDEQEDAKRRFAMFSAWAKRTAGMEHYAGNIDALFAVAQHYGIATPFVDFTTDPGVALQFALLGKSDRDHAAIVLLNSSEFNDFREKLCDLVPALERVKILEPDTPNLWRLQAQKGVFLDLPAHNFEQTYDFDRILFPADDDKALHDLSLVYPDRKSDLEILIDRYFMDEKLKRGSAFAEHTFSDTMVFMTLENPKIRNGINSSFVYGGVNRESSWNALNTEGWMYSQLPPEKYQSPESQIYNIVLSEVSFGESHDGSLVNSLLKALDAGTLKRSIPHGFEITLQDYWPGQYADTRLAAGVSRIWDGMRRLPYANSDIARAISNYFSIARINGNMENLYSSPINVEFSSQPSGSYSRATIPFRWRDGLVRNDIKEFILPEWQEKLSRNLHGMLKAVQDPARLFDFHMFAKLFAEHVIPSQEYQRGGLKLAQYYSPAELLVFGLS